MRAAERAAEGTQPAPERSALEAIARAFAP